jgi:phenylacetate-CoA ligase
LVVEENLMPHSSSTASALPLYRNSIDWDAFYRDYPPPDVWYDTMFKWSADQVQSMQNERFLATVNYAWNNPFYRERWSAKGIAPGDIRGINDIGKLPTYSSEDIKDDIKMYPPFGRYMGADPKTDLGTTPLKMQTSGGTTGMPRPTLYGPVEWEMNALTLARSMYVQGGRPGDVLQVPTTCSLANFAWGYYKGGHEYLGMLPITTGSGVVTPSRRQLEIAEVYGTNVWAAFPEYLTQLAKTYREEFGRDVRDLKTKFIATYLGPDLDDSLRQHVETLWGCPAYDNYGTHETGGAAFEGPDKDGLYIMEDNCYFEVLDVDTDQPCKPGEAGNLVVTMFSRRIPPIIRFNLRDLARIFPQKTSALGSNFRRMDHFLGRSDAMVKLRGTNVYPMACLTAIRSDSRTTGEWVCVVERFEKSGALRDEMLVKVELKKGIVDVEGLKEALERRLHADLSVKVDVLLVPEGGIAEEANLGREGKPKRLIDKRDQVRKRT